MNHPYSVSISELFVKSAVFLFNKMRSFETVKDRKSKRRGDGDEVWSDSLNKERKRRKREERGWS